MDARESRSGSEDVHHQDKTLERQSRRQCELLSTPRASLYRASQGERSENLKLIQTIDKTFLAGCF